MPAIQETTDATFHDFWVFICITTALNGGFKDYKPKIHQKMDKVCFDKFCF